MINDHVVWRCKLTEHHTCNVIGIHDYSSGAKIYDFLGNFSIKKKHLRLNDAIDLIKLMEMLKGFL